jgi:S1-C subfamily serine protease
MGRVFVWLGVGVALALPLPAEAGPPVPPSATEPSSRVPTPADDHTFRPTVVVRSGQAQGSGTIIASVDGETLVLTAAHVVFEGKRTPEVEFHRYNVGLERRGGAGSASRGGWPRAILAELVATDRAADLAVLRVPRLKRLPYVAQLAPEADPLEPGTVVTSVGVDLGVHLIGWSARVVGVDQFVLEHQAEQRPFVITSRPPEHGRSGGGLFLSSGELIGVCIGRTLDRPGARDPDRVGFFAAAASIHRLLRDHGLAETVARSQSLSRPITTTRQAAGGAPAPEVYLSKPAP